MQNATQRSSILFVDDEPNILAALRRTMHSMRSAFEVSTACGAEEALELAHNQNVDIIVSDMRMPGLSGADLLKQIRRKHPHTIRLVLSGQASLKSTIQAISSTHQYLSKPCNLEDLKDVITNLQGAREMVTSPIIRKHLACLSALPCRREVIETLLATIRANHLNRHNLALIAIQDLGATATLIHIARSMCLSEHSSILTLSDAFGSLSDETLLTIAETPELFLPTNDDFHGLSLEQLTEHSVRVADLARDQSRSVLYNDGDKAWLTGLLHDFGKLVLAACFGEHTLPHQTQQAEQMLSPPKNLVSHQSAGAYVLNLWGFPTDLVHAVLTHHDEGTRKSPRLCDLTSIVRHANAQDHRNGGNS